MRKAPDRERQPSPRAVALLDLLQAHRYSPFVRAVPPHTLEPGCRNTL